ncbi:MAG: cytochrome c biogenesis protein CcdA [Desulfurispora sp.]|uniref:cytochrome c biogenesis protein CcdA n=1 Tax=Desulfurispora sp. TaxID=3014275 RepID=UPI00404A1029
MEQIAWHISFGTAFLLGLLSFFSPCILPLLPVYFSYLAGHGVTLENDPGAMGSGKARLQLFTRSMFFVLGFGLVFLLLGAGFGLLGTLGRAHRPALEKTAAILIMLMGAHLAGLLPLRALYRTLAPLRLAGRPGTLSGALLLGLALGAGWTPCAGPALASLLALAGSSQSAGYGITLLFFYTTGLGLPFLLSAILLERLNPVWNVIRRHQGLVESISGGILLAAGTLMLLGWWNKLALFLLPGP